ncbi:hypothetical protein Pla163_18510 [Planctomycetes bacterium Pla163]|uniref:Haloacid dehalogenase-like hydrolase n=1 Tax=Rohdeia mirabilis TaxID=2528008 RepID=A0A518CZU5_9BACT|nr:hypothetical protein Pla163_18510 [Planctomycetes bacterium Pla163]
MKILSDFDGVWTDPTHEAVAVEHGLADDLASLTGFDVERVRADLVHCRERALESAVDHGWIPGDRITAYCDEDAFLAVSGIASYLARGACEVSAPYRGAHESRGGPTFMELADQSFRRLGARPGVGELLPDAGATLKALEELGVDLVVVSNSDTEKLVRLFADAGIAAATDGSARVRVRGGARKWALGDAPESIDVGGRVVDVNRPHYRSIIEEERPDLIVGDVYSLDLALPFHMRSRGEPAAPRFLVHRPPCRPTPWVAGHGVEGRVDSVAARLSDLVGVVRERLGRG